MWGSSKTGILTGKGFIIGKMGPRFTRGPGKMINMRGTGLIMTLLGIFSAKGSGKMMLSLITIRLRIKKLVPSKL